MLNEKYVETLRSAISLIEELAGELNKKTDCTCILDAVGGFDNLKQKLKKDINDKASIMLNDLKQDIPTRNSCNVLRKSPKNKKSGTKIDLDEIVSVNNFKTIEKKSNKNLFKKESKLSSVRSILLKAKKPLHINDICKKMNIEEKDKINSLCSALGLYCRNKNIFKKTARSTFTLI